MHLLEGTDSCFIRIDDHLIDDQLASNGFLRAGSCFARFGQISLGINAI
ncbi:hypothetical protein ABIC75_004544 [Dyella japonica]|uniref:Uncharacterized protein n=1 Tax=Dyella japonica TaxID=231455 RepID=A0ABV2K137_9GAMM